MNLVELPKTVDRSLFKVERWVTPQEGASLLTLIEAHGIRTFLESGTANGYSALWAAFAGSAVITWDIVERPKLWDHVPETAPYADRIECRVAPFGDQLPQTVGPRMWFIDGDHTAEGVLRDWRVVRMCAQLGDVVVFHDVLSVTVVGALYRELTRTFLGGIIYTPRGLGVLLPQQFTSDALAEGAAGEVASDL